MGINHLLGAAVEVEQQMPLICGWILQLALTPVAVEDDRVIGMDVMRCGQPTAYCLLMAILLASADSMFQHSLEEI